MMIMEALLAVCMVVGLVGLHGVHGYPDGAQTDVCVSMTPSHDSSVTQPSLQYSITTTNTIFSAGTKIEVTIKGTFMGYLIQARIPGTATIVGTWDAPPPGNKFLQCNAAADSLTHSNSDSKTDLKLIWNPPTTNPPASVEFVATVVKTKLVWQSFVKSTAITASGYTTTTPSSATTKAGSSAERTVGTVSVVILGALLTVVRALF